MELDYFFGNNDYRFERSANSFIDENNGAFAIGLRNINGTFITNKISIGALCSAN